jgi:hypothetical protein
VLERDADDVGANPEEGRVPEAQRPATPSAKSSAAAARPKMTIRVPILSR